MRVLHRIVAGLAFLLSLGAAPVEAQTGFENLVDHVHLSVPDQAAAVEFYRKHFGGQPFAEGTDRLMFDQTRLLFRKDPAASPSAGSVLDHIGFSVEDVDATLRALEADGAKVTTPARDVEGLFRLAFAEDPWGTRLEILHDPDRLGLHHVHLRGPDPATMLAWYSAKFGGTVRKFKERADGIDYAGVWLLVQRAEAVPSEGHAIDHIGFRPRNVDAAIDRLKAMSVKVTAEPRALTLDSGVSMRIAYVEGPEGARIELVQRELP